MSLSSEEFDAFLDGARKLYVNDVEENHCKLSVEKIMKNELEFSFNNLEYGECGIFQSFDEHRPLQMNFIAEVKYSTFEDVSRNFH